MKYQKLKIKYQRSILNIKNIFAFLFVVLIFAFCTLNYSYAQQVSLSISPPLLELFIKPGKAVMVAYRLENLGDPTFLNLKILPFEAKDNLGNIRIKPEFEGPVRFGLDNSNLTLDQTFFLKTNESQQILLRIRIPENITDGDYYYTLLAETIPPTPSEGIGSARAKATIGSNILVTISNSGNVDIKPKVALFSTRGGWTFGQNFKIYDSSDKIPVVLNVVNKGKTLMKPEGQIIMKGSLGEKAEYEIISKNILAESERLLEATPSADLSSEINHPSSLILSGFFIGKYSLSTQIKFGENSPTIFASTVFYAFPFKIMGGVLLAVIVVVFIIKRVKDED